MKKKFFNKKLINFFIVALLALSALTMTCTVTVQAKSLNKNTLSSYITESNLDNTKEEILNPTWGLGTNQTEYISNNRSYTWYIGQGNTGKFSNNNCGPCCATMALKWIDSKFSKTPEDARNTYLNDGGWWYTNNIENYLKLYETNYSVQAISENLLKDQLKHGNIAILCINTTYIPYNNSLEQRVGRFYNYAGGHFIIVKGYRVVDGKTYFEVYDPNNWNKYYKEGQEKGKDRYYLSKDLISAASNWWNHSIIIHP